MRKLQCFRLCRSTKLVDSVQFLRSPFVDFQLWKSDPRSYHWYMSIIPHVSATAGFEMGSGMFINPSIPEDSANYLRNAVAESAVYGAK